MVVLIIVFAVSVLVIGITHIPVSVFIEYQDDVVIYLKALFIRYNIFYDKKPKQSMSVREYNRLEKKRKKRLAAQKKADKESKKEKEVAEKKPSSLEKAKKVLRLIREFSSLVIDVLKEFFKEIVISINAMNINVSCENVSDTALLYTGISQAMNALFAVIEENKLGRIDYDNVSCSCDYLSGQFEAQICISVTIRIGGAVRLAAYALYSFLKKKKNERKKYGQQNQ